MARSGSEVPNQRARHFILCVGSREPGRLHRLFSLLLPDRDQSRRSGAQRSRHRHHGLLSRYPNRFDRRRGDVPRSARQRVCSSSVYLLATKPQIIGEGRATAEVVRCLRRSPRIGKSRCRRISLCSRLACAPVSPRPRISTRYSRPASDSTGSSSSVIPSWRRWKRRSKGVLLAGTVQGPKDIVDTVAQASAAAAKACGFPRL